MDMLLPAILSKVPMWKKGERGGDTEEMKCMSQGIDQGKEGYLGDEGDLRVSST